MDDPFGVEYQHYLWLTGLPCQKEIRRYYQDEWQFRQLLKHHIYSKFCSLFLIGRFLLVGCFRGLLNPSGDVLGITAVRVIYKSAYARFILVYGNAAFELCNCFIQVSFVSRVTSVFFTPFIDSFSLEAIYKFSLISANLYLVCYVIKWKHL